MNRSGCRRGAAGGAALCLAGLLLLLLGGNLARSLPIVDPGLFVILGVRTCGGGGGYCLLGTDCTLDRDFAADVEGGHCDGLRAAFTPAAHFSCCKYVERSNATLPGEPADATTTEDPALAATTLQPDAENVIETEIRVKPAEGQDKPVDVDAVKEEVEDAVKEEVEDAVKEAVEDAVKKAGEDTTKEPVEDAVKEEVEDAVKEADEVAVKEADDEVVAEASEDAVEVAEAAGEDSDKNNTKTAEKDAAEEPVSEDIKPAEKDNVVLVPLIEPPRVPLGPASGQTVVAVSEEYKVKGAQDEEEEAEEAEVVAVADTEKEAVLVSPSCVNPSADVNPCWRSSFQDRQGATLCSGTLVGVDAAVTTAVCASRLLEAGMGAVALRVDGVSMPVRDVAVHPDYLGATDDANDVAVVRLFMPAGPPPGVSPVGPFLGVAMSAPAAMPSPSCIACLPVAEAALPAGKTCYALAARLNGLGVETSAVCAGRIASAQTVHVKLGGCEVANLKNSIAAGEQVLAVRAREGAAMVCDGTLHGLASTPSGSFASLGRHTKWLSKTLAAPRTSTFRA